jgi:hypothetical protein
MPSKDPVVLKRNSQKYKNSAHGRARINATKKVWARTEAGQKSIKASGKEWRKTAEYKEGQAAKSRERKFKRKQWLYGIKSKLSCSRCGYDKHPVALQFHHLNGDDKIGEINRLLYRTNASLDAVLKEMAKCTVLCANCHAIHHYEEYYNNAELRPDAV